MNLSLKIARLKEENIVTRVRLSHFLSITLDELLLINNSDAIHAVTRIINGFL